MSPWKEMDAYHMLMMATWHPARDKGDLAPFRAKAKEMVRFAAAKGAEIVLLPELFETPYFCQDQSAEHFALARPFEGNPVIAAAHSGVRVVRCAARSSGRSV